MALIETTIDTDGGGNYTSRNQWETAEQTDLVADGNNHLAHLEGAAADTAILTLNGWITDSTHIITIQASTDRHPGYWDDTKARIVVTNGTCWTVQDNFVKFIGEQCSVNMTGATDTRAGILIMGAAYVYIASTIFKNTNASATVNDFGLYNYDGTNVKLWNCLAYDMGREGKCFLTSGGTAIFYNCTASNGYSNFNSSGGTGTCWNCVSEKSRLANTAYSGTWNVASDYNMSDDTSSTGGAHDHTGHTFTFVSATDFHLQSIDVGAIDLGVTDPSSGLYSDDVDGETRTGTWDCGFDEYVAAAGGLSISIAQRYYRNLRN